MKDTIFVYCNDKMISLMSQNIKPVDYSTAMIYVSKTYYTAEYDRKTLLDLPVDFLNAQEAWWCEIGSHDKSPEHWNDFVIARHYKRSELKKVGLLAYLWDNYGIGSNKSTAHAISILSNLENMTPIEFFNQIEKWHLAKQRK